MKSPEFSVKSLLSHSEWHSEDPSIAFNIEEIKGGLRKTPHIVAMLALLMETVACATYEDMRATDTMDGGRFGLTTVGNGLWQQYTEANLVQRGYPPKTLKLQLQGQILSQLLPQMKILSDGDEAVKTAIKMANDLVDGSIGKDGLVYQDLMVDLAYKDGISGDLIQYAAVATTAGLAVWATAIIANAMKKSAKEERKGEENKKPNQQIINNSPSASATADPTASAAANPTASASANPVTTSEAGASANPISISAAEASSISNLRAQLTSDSSIDIVTRDKLKRMNDKQFKDWCIGNNRWN